MNVRSRRLRLAVLAGFALLLVDCGGAGETPVGPEQPPALSWPYDQTGRYVIHRGCVTLTNVTDTSVSPPSLLGDVLEYTVADYQRLRSWGANVQQIRILAGQVGAWPGHEADPRYLAHLDTMISRASQVGIATILKLTFYDVGGSPLGPTAAEWAAVWENRFGAQQRILEGWRNLWIRYRGNPAVVGYDLLNEVYKGSLPVGDATFIAQSLNPLYRNLIDQLKATDPSKTAFFQPPVRDPRNPPFYMAYTDPIGRTGVVYAPHFYPNVTTFYTSSYAPEMDRLVREARDVHRVPMFIGEYHPRVWYSADDGDRALEEMHRHLEQEMARQIDRYGLGSTRPWFADDRAALGAFTSALIKGTAGLQGEERTFVTDVLARPYPRVTAGTPRSYAFDFDTRVFSMTFTPDYATGPSEIFVPRRRHYPSGFRLEYSPGLLLAHDPASPTGLSVLANPGGVDPGVFAWDEPSSAVVVRRWHQAPGDHHIRLSP